VSSRAQARDLTNEMVITQESLCDVSSIGEILHCVQDDNVWSNDNHRYLAFVINRHSSFAEGPELVEWGLRHLLCCHES